MTISAYTEFFEFDNLTEDDNTHKPKYDKEELRKQDLIGLNQYWYHQADIETKSGKRHIKQGATPVYKVVGGELQPFSAKDKEEFHAKQKKSQIAKQTTPTATANTPTPQRFNPPHQRVSTPLMTNASKMADKLKDTFKKHNLYNLYNFSDDFQKILATKGKERQGVANKFINKYQLSTDGTREMLFLGVLPENLKELLKSNPESSQAIVQYLDNIGSLIPYDSSVSMTPFVREVLLKKMLEFENFYTQSETKSINISYEKEVDGSVKILRIDNTVFVPEEIPPIKKIYHKEKNYSKTKEELRYNIKKVILDTTTLNKKISMLSEMDSIMVVDLFDPEMNQTEKLLDMIDRKLIFLLRTNLINIEIFNKLGQLFRKLGSEKNKDKFNKIISNIFKIVVKTDLKHGEQAFLKFCSAIRQSVSGHTVYIPTTKVEFNYDIISVKNRNRSSSFDAHTRLNSIQFIYVSSTSLMNDPVIDKAHCLYQTVFLSKDARKDLIYLFDMAPIQLFKVTPEQRQVVHGKVLEIIAKWKDELTDYYKFSSRLEDATMAAKYISTMLSYGVVPENGQIQNKSNIFGRKDIENIDAWKLYSIIGFVGDALYNIFTSNQIFNIHTYDEDGLHITNGDTTIGKMYFKFIVDFNPNQWPLVPKNDGGQKAFMFYTQPKHMKTY